MIIYLQNGSRGLPLSSAQFISAMVACCCSAAATTSSGENECVATSIRREVGISFGFTTTSWMNLVMENFFDFPLVTIIHPSRQNTIAIMACLWMLIAFYRAYLSLV